MGFGPTKEIQICRVKTNEELDRLIKHKNIQLITLKLKDQVALVTYKGCQISE
jgi:bacillopeptidase F (M6 metalloprotease family)